MNTTNADVVGGAMPLPEDRRFARAWEKTVADRRRLRGLAVVFRDQVAHGGEVVAATIDRFVASWPETMRAGGPWGAAIIADVSVGRRFLALFDRALSLFAAFHCPECGTLEEHGRELCAACNRVVEPVSVNHPAILARLHQEFPDLVRDAADVVELAVLVEDMVGPGATTAGDDIQRMTTPAAVAGAAAPGAVTAPSASTGVGATGIAGPAAPVGDGVSPFRAWVGGGRTPLRDALTALVLGTALALVGFVAFVLYFFGW